MEDKISKIVDCTGDNCPMPLVKTRQTIMEGQKGEVVKVVGTHPESFKEIPMALEAMGIEIIGRGKEDNEKWHIIFKI